MVVTASSLTVEKNSVDETAVNRKRRAALCLLALGEPDQAAWDLLRRDNTFSHRSFFQDCYDISRGLGVDASRAVRPVSAELSEELAWAILDLSIAVRSGADLSSTVSWLVQIAGRSLETDLDVAGSCLRALGYVSHAIDPVTAEQLAAMAARKGGPRIFREQLGLLKRRTDRLAALELLLTLDTPAASVLVEIGDLWKKLGQGDLALKAYDLALETLELGSAEFSGAGRSEWSRRHASVLDRVIAQAISADDRAHTFRTLWAPNRSPEALKIGAGVARLALRSSGGQIFWGLAACGDGGDVVIDVGQLAANVWSDDSDAAPWIVDQLKAEVPVLQSDGRRFSPSQSRFFAHAEDPIRWKFPLPTPVQQSLLGAARGGCGVLEIATSSQYRNLPFHVAAIDENRVLGDVFAIRHPLALVVERDVTDRALSGPWAFAAGDRSGLPQLDVAWLDTSSAAVSRKQLLDMFVGAQKLLFYGHHGHPGRDLFDIDIHPEEQERVSGLLCDDGVLTAEQIRGSIPLNSAPSLVVLVACGSSGRPTPHSDEWFGVSHALLDRGAHRVIGTIWPLKVDQRALSAFVTLLVGHIDRFGPDEGLKRALVARRSAVDPRPFGPSDVPWVALSASRASAGG